MVSISLTPLRIETHESMIAEPTPAVIDSSEVPTPSSAITSVVVPSGPVVASNNLTHLFAGSYSLGGIRHDKEALGRWFKRVGTVLPNLKFEVTSVLVQGGPWSTTVVARWVATCNLENGEPYEERTIFSRVLKGFNSVISWGEILYGDTPIATFWTTRACGGEALFNNLAILCQLPNYICLKGASLT